MMSTAELAARLGISPRRARELLATGVIRGAQRVGRAWVIVDDIEAVHAGQSRRTQTGPRPKEST